MVARSVRGTVRVSLSSGYRGVALMAKFRDPVVEESYQALYQRESDLLCSGILQGLDSVRGQTLG